VEQNEKIHENRWLKTGKKKKREKEEFPLSQSKEKRGEKTLAPPSQKSGLNKPRQGRKRHGKWGKTLSGRFSRLQNSPRREGQICHKSSRVN